MAEIDRLDIVIATSVKNAKDQITQLQNEIKRMQKTLGSLSANKAIKNTGKGVSNSVRQQSQRMVREYSKAAKTMDVIRDKMVTKAFDIPDTKTGAMKALEEYKKMYANARDKVASAQAHSENYGKVYRNNVENMYKAAQGIKAARQVLNEKAAKDEAYQRLLDEERAAKEAANSVEELATAYEDVAKSSSKVKYVNQSRIGQFRDAYNQGKARIGASPYLKTNEEEAQSYRSLRDTIASAIDSIRGKAEEMKSTVGITFENMKAKVDGFKLSMREKAVASGILSHTQDFVTLQKSIEKSRAEYAKLTAQMKEYEESGLTHHDAYKRFQKRKPELESEISNSEDYMRRMKMDGSAYEINTQTATQNLERLKSAFQKVADTAKRAAKAVGSFLLNVTGIKKASDKAKSAMNNVTGMAKRLAKELTRVGKMFKLMITRMALRAVISNVGDGFKSLAIHSENFNNAMSNLINSAKTLGYSIAGMVSPLINALAPALVYIINLITQAVNAINQLFSALTGAGTWNKAKNFTDSWADSIKGTTGAAKELKKTVLGFDELNQLQDNKNSGGGSNGITDMFETVKIDPKWKEVADWLKEMWKNKDFTQLGTELGTRIKNALDSIPWEKIRQTSNDLGKALATLINGLVEVEGLGYSIGTTVAQGVNTVFEFINGFVHNLHWDSIGKFIADTFNGFFENIDWNLIKDTVYTGLEGLADSINSFVKNFHWDNISTFISNAINTIATGIYKFVKKVDWKTLGTELGNQLNETIKKTDWRQIGRTIGSIIQSAIDFCKSFIKQLRWEDVKKAVQDLVGGFFEECDKEELGKIVAGVLGAVLVIGATKALATAAVKAIGTKIISSLFGTATVAGATGAAASFGTTIMASLVSAIVGYNVGNKIGQKLSELFGDEESKKLYEKYQGIAGGIQLIIDTSVVFTERLGEHFDDFKKSAGECYSNVKEAAKTFVERTNEHLTSFKEKAVEVFEKADEKVNNFGTKLNEKTATAKEDLQGLATTAVEKVGAVRDSFAELAEKGGQKLQDVQTSCINLATNVKTKYEEIKTNVSEKVTNIKGKLDEWSKKTSEIKQSIGTSISNLKTDVSTKIDNLKSKTTELSSHWKEKLENAKSSLEDFRREGSSKLEEIKRKVEDFKTNTATYIDTIKSNFTSLKDDIAKAFSKENWTFSGVADGLKKTFESAKEAIACVWNSIADKLNGEHDIASSKLKINLPKFATGGFPKDDSLFLANSSEMLGRFSNGKTAVANNAQIVEGIERGVYSAVSAAMSQQGSSNGYISNEIIVDGEVIARTITKAQEKQNRRFSPQTV